MEAGSNELAVEPSDGRRPKRRAIVVVGAVTLAAAASWAVLFAAPHGHLSVLLSEYGCRVAPASGACQESHFGLELAWIGPLLLDYLSWAAAGMLLVLAGRRVLAVVPAVAGVLVPAALSGSERWASFGGRFMNVFFWPPSFARIVGHAAPAVISHRILGGVVGAVLVLAPASAAFVVVRPARAPRMGRPEVTGLALVIGSMVALAWLLGPFDLLRLGSVSTAAAILALGAGLGVGSRRRVLSLAVLALLFTGLVTRWSVGWFLGFASADPGYLTGSLEAALWVGVAFVAAEAVRPDPIRIKLRFRSRSVAAAT